MPWCRLATSGLGVLVPSILLADWLYWDSRAADFASPVLQLPWEDLVHERKLNESGLKQGAKSEGCNRPLGSFEHPSDGRVAGLRGLSCLVVRLLSLSLRAWGSCLQLWGVRRQDKWMGRLQGNPCQREL